MTASVLQAEKSLRKPSVVLDNPANARPITGMIGAPHPITLHGPDVSPRTLMPAPTKPARPLVVDLHPPPETPPPRYRQSTKYAATSSETAADGTETAADGSQAGRHRPHHERGSLLVSAVTGGKVSFARETVNCPGGPGERPRRPGGCLVDE